MAKGGGNTQINHRLHQFRSAGQFWRISHRAQVPAGASGQVPEQVEVRGEKEPWILGTTACMGEEGAFGVDARDQSLIGEDPQGRRGLE
ncbi:hypothetical protein [Arthrobacter sp. SD76]|uniref:hypothetical protein n=1 Tax=Arthrobacter sp. SD76 TaxID=3415007 RepID=UPI003C757742